MPTAIRAAIISAIVLFVSALVLIGGVPAVAHSAAAGGPLPAPPVCIQWHEPGSGSCDDGFTWG